MNKGIIFDLDGTLWEVTDITYENIKKVAQKYNVNDIKLETVKGIFGKSFLECARILFPTQDDETAIKLLKEASIEMTNELCEKGGNLYPKLEETIKKLSEQYLLFIVSNSGHTEYIEAFLKTSGLAQYFKDYIAAGALKMTKAEGIQKIINDYNLQQAIYVGDTDKDQEAANIANISFIHAKYGYMKNLKSDYSIGEIEELPNIVTRCL